jgi:hypothetical protein
MVFAVVADLGQTLDSVSTVNHMLQDTDAQMLLHAGEYTNKYRIKFYWIDSTTSESKIYKQRMV